MAKSAINRNKTQRAQSSRVNGKLGGRPKGSKTNTELAEIKTLARKHAPDCFLELVRLSSAAESENARLAAIKEVLDRAYGRSPQPISGDNEGGPVQLVVSWL